MAFSVGGRSPFSAQMNVTPLIDVLLVLIIVFMVVESMSQQQGLNAQIPQPARDSKQIPDVRTIVIQVAWKGNDKIPAIKINDESVRWEDLQARLRAIYLTRAERVAFVKGDEDVDFEYIADVIDVARGAGVERVGLLTKDLQTR